VIVLDEQLGGERIRSGVRRWSPGRVAVVTDLAARDVAIHGLEVLSRVLLNQIRTVDKRRLRRRVGEVTSEEMAQVDQAIRVSPGLEPL
jgi:mRNA-degrading endonuclease toxin of MazEF toxin-antitoxin module